MKFNTGLFDALFGKKMTIQVPQDDGATREIPVTEAWFKKMQAEGKISMSDKPPNSIAFHVIGPDGSETRHLQVGIDITDAQYQKLVDPKTGALYGLTVYENGTPKTTIIKKLIWDQAKTQHELIDREAEVSLSRIKKMLDNMGKG